MNSLRNMFRLVGLFLVATLLTACGGGGGDGVPQTDTGLTPSSITVTPSLGVITNATVSIYKADGTTFIGSGDLGSSGKVTISFNDYSGPVVIEVAGNAAARYFDEATNGLVAFPADKKFHAIAPTSSGTFAVTLLTELAYQRALATNGFPLVAANVTALNESVRKALIPEIGDLLTPPTIYNSSTTANSLGNDDAGKYALKLAALAQFGSGQAAPALAIMQILTQDIGDGVINGKDSANASINAPYSNFSTELMSKLTSTAESYGTPELKTALGGYPALAPNVGGGGNGAGGSGSLAIANAPSFVGNTFIASNSEIDNSDASEPSITWINDSTVIGVVTDGLTNNVKLIAFSSLSSSTSGGAGWVCSNAVDSPIPCSGVTLNRSAGTLTLANTKLTGGTNGVIATYPDITLNGTLTFTPSSIGGNTGGSGESVNSTTGNNSAVLSGAAIGKGTTSVDNLRKQIAVTVLGQGTLPLTVGTAYATRSSTSSYLDYAYIILPVTNTGNQLLCYIELAGLTYRNASGVALADPGYTYVRGSVGKQSIFSSNYYTNSCLAPGETGWVIDIESIYSNVAAMEFTFESSSSALSAPTARVIPQSYTVNPIADGGGQSLAVTVTNIGSGSAQISGFGNLLVLFDDAMRPLFYDVASDVMPSNGLIPVSGTATLTTDYLGSYYEGSGQKLLVFVDFEDTTTASARSLAGSINPASEECDAALSRDELNMCILESRNRRIAAQEASMQ